MLADRMGISIPAYSKIETGYTDVNLSRIAQIAEIYDISVFQLLMSEDGELDPEASSHIAMLQKKLASREAEIEILLRKIIELYEGNDHKKLA